MKDKLFYIKIVGAIVASLVLSGLIMVVVFPTKTPRVRPNLQSYLANKISRNAETIIEELRKNIPKFSKSNVSNPIPQSTPTLEGSETGLISAKEALKEVPYNTVSKGIYVKSDTNFSYTLVKEKEVNWTEVSVDMNGKNVKVLVPSGEQEPNSF